MEFINGSEAVQIIRNLENKKKIKGITIASVTAFEDEIIKTGLVKAGVDYLLKKPCDKNSLLFFLRNLRFLNN